MVYEESVCCVFNIMKCELGVLRSYLQTRHQLEKQLDWENCHLYSKLGLRWKLARQRCDSSLMLEHVRTSNYCSLFISNIVCCCRFY